MALPNILATGTTKLVPEEAADAPVVFDAVISEGFDTGVTVTDHPIEDGADISDHIRDNPDTLQIDIVVSRTPANIPDLVKVLASPDYDRHETAWYQIYQWIKSHELVKVVTNARTWRGMAIESMSRKRTSAVGEALEATIKLKQIVKVQSHDVAAPTRPAGVQNQQKQNGTTTAKPTSDESIVHFAGKSAVDGLKSFFSSSSVSPTAVP